jgi:outer membrane lipoprotein-sorting protein
MIKKVLIYLLFAVVLSGPVAAETPAPDPVKTLEAMDLLMRGRSHEMTVQMEVKTKRWERTYKIRIQMRGVDQAFARVLEPAKTRGQGFLRLQARLWQYLPTAERTVLIPPSLMLDDFMGSDFSNDDFVKLSYLPRDYTARVDGEDSIDGHDTWRLELDPKPDAPVTYGRLTVWVRKQDSAPVRWDFYNERLELIRTLHYSGFKGFNGREIPSVWRMENRREPARSTTVTILEAAYDTDIPDSVFTRARLEKFP